MYYLVIHHFLPSVIIILFMVQKADECVGKRCEVIRLKCARSHVLLTPRPFIL